MDTRQAFAPLLYTLVHTLAYRYHSVVLLQRGFVSGSILTVDPEEAKVRQDESGRLRSSSDGSGRVFWKDEME